MYVARSGEARLCPVLIVGDFLSTLVWNCEVDCGALKPAEAALVVDRLKLCEYWVPVWLEAIDCAPGLNHLLNWCLAPIEIEPDVLLVTTGD